MTTAAFPAGFNLARSAVIRTLSTTAVDIMTDGTPRQRTLTANFYTTINCVYEYLTVIEKITLEWFLAANMANTITMTIDGYNYSGVILDGYEITMNGPLYQVSFNYYAKIV